MNALDPELSEESPAVEISFEKTIKRLLKLLSHCILSNGQCTAFSFTQWTASSFTPSTFLLSNGPCCAACFSDANCSNAACIASFSGISCFTETGGKMTDRLQFWEFCIQEAWCSGKPLHHKELVDALIQTKKIGQRNREWPQSVFADSETQQ